MRASEYHPPEVKSKLLEPGSYFMQGNIAVAEGALVAGCKFYAGYPITPSSEIAEHMASRIFQVGGHFIQMEDEIASIMAILGASAAGVKSMTATSGPGFSLMMEEIGLAAMMEIPCVIVDVMRAGPSTGIPTLVGQGDVMQAKWGSHGDYELVAYLPNSPQEMFEMAIKAFNTSEAYRIPVIILADQVVGHMYGKVVVPPLDEIEIVDRPKPTVPPEEYLPYDSRYLVPPMAIAGTGYRVNNESLTHDDRGYPSISREVSFKLVSRLVNKVRENAEKIAEWEEYMVDDAEVVLIAYGSTSRSAREAVKLARREGLRVGLFRPKTAWPFPGWALRKIDREGRARAFITVEINMGQIYHVVNEYVKAAEVHHIPHAPGYLPDPNYILKNVKKLCGYE